MINTSDTVLVDSSPFVWTEFMQRDWDDNQLFIIEYYDGQKKLITYIQFMKCTHVSRVGVKNYIAINWR